MFAAYPSTPAGDVLHHLSELKRFGVRTFQAEDEMAAVGAAIGAAFGGALGVTATTGPGMCLKTEAVGLAVMTELPRSSWTSSVAAPARACRPRRNRPIYCKRYLVVTENARP